MNKERIYSDKRESQIKKSFLFGPSEVGTRGSIPLINIWIIVVVVILAVFTGGYLVMNQQKISSINSFEECAAAGYPIMESYPEQCATPDGRTFVRIIVPEEPQPVFCTQDAKLCPDGSYVGRIGPNCEFAACPQLRACTMEAKLCPDGSAVGRTGPNCEFAPCPPSPPTSY